MQAVGERTSGFSLADVVGITQMSCYSLAFWWKGQRSGYAKAFLCQGSSCPQSISAGLTMRQSGVALASAISSNCFIGIGEEQQDAWTVAVWLAI